MTRKVLPWALSMIALTIPACGSDEVSTTTDPAETPESAATSAPEPSATPRAADALFNETFDDDRNGWGEIDDGEFGTIDIVDGDMQWIDATGRVIVWGPGTLIDGVEGGSQDLTNVTVQADVTFVSGTGVIGLACRVVPDQDAEMQWYDFVLRDGYAAIRLDDDQSHIKVLAEADTASVPFGTPINLSASCIDDAEGVAHLTFSVDGKVLLEATDDDPLGNGWASPTGWTFPEGSPIEVHWHDFTVTPA
jgi:hypothetical protein